MRKLVNLVSMGTLTVLVGCGQDVGSGSRRTLPVVDRPGVNTTSPEIRSFIHRDREASQITYKTEITQTLSSTLPIGLYRAIPRMSKDDEGSSRNTISVSTYGSRTNCGTGTFLSITQRIDDCSSKNGEKAVWQGSKFGASGEGTWKLVARSAANKEIWIDSTTGMVWSYLISNPAGKSAFNWCKASGNGEGATPTEIIDCAKESANESVCEGAVLEEVGEQIKWRLPTRNDFLQADLNGFRFVLAKENAEQGLWTATMRAAGVGRSEAWVYSSAEGTLKEGNLLTERQVRCIGAPLM